jgi:hypothetical protein
MDRVCNICIVHRGPTLRQAQDDNVFLMLIWFLGAFSVPFGSTTFGTAYCPPVKGRGFAFLFIMIEKSGISLIFV